MAPLPPAANVFKVEVLGDTTAGRNWANILHFIWSGSTPTNTIAASFAESIFGAWNTNIIPYQTTDISLTGVQVTDLTSDTGAQASYEGSEAGTSVREIITGGVAVLAQYTVARRYRGGHPRTYILAGGQGDLLNTSQWTSTFVGSMNTQWEAFLNAVVGLSSGGCTVGDQVIVSYRTGNAPRTDALVENVTYTGISSTVASQRRRARRRS